MITPGAAAAIALLAFVTPARGGIPVPITNAGFENPVLATDGAYTASIVGWTAFNAGDIGVFNIKTTDYPAQAPEGFNVAFIYNNAASVTGFSQVLSGATGQLQADASYTLTVKVGDALSYTYPGYKIQLLANGTVLAEDDNTLAPITNGTFATTTLNYTYNAGLHAALVGKPLEIRLLCKGLVVGGEVEFDNVQLSVTLANPVAAPGGPYPVLSIGSLSLNGSASQPVDGSSISLYEWDLNNDDIFGDATGATPVAIPAATLMSTYGMILGENTIKLRVTDATAKTATASTTVSLTVASSNANLVSLATGPYMELTPYFDSGTLSYTATVPYSTTSMTVTPIKENAAATIKVNDVAVASGSASASISLIPGPNTITTVVTAEDTTTNTYTLVVTRGAPSSNANLDNLVPSAGTLNPGFDPGSFSYTASVSNATTTMTVTPTKADVTASIKVNDVAVASGSASAPTSLSVGDTTITTVVTAEDGGTTKTYTLTVTRAPDTAPPVIASLSPADETTARPTINLAVTFDEPIAIGTGFITLKNLTDSSTVVININSGSPQVTVTGAVLTINPTADLAFGSNYAIQIDPDAIQDLFNNPFAGIADDTTWNFATTFPYYLWTQTAGGAQDWATGANWSGGTALSPGANGTVDFSTVNIAANTTLTLGADRTAGFWKFGDTSGAQTWAVNSGNQMILAGATPTINVVNSTDILTLSNVVAGTQSLTKSGAGAMTLNGAAANTFTGGLNVNGAPCWSITPIWAPRPT